jgi:thiamine kinase-like enzyme
MGVTKKPAVIAKTAAKKRGRPVGSKNKPKIIKMLEVQVKEGRKQANKYPVDWERLAKQLQEALAAQMRESDSYKKLFEELEKNSRSVSVLSFWQRVKLVFTGSY